MVGAGTDKTKAPLVGGPVIILVRPQLAVNIGMCARAMANFGLDDLRLVNPKAGWPRSDEYREIAYSAAAGATHLLDAARVFDSVEAAVGDLQFVYAATARDSRWAPTLRLTRCRALSTVLVSHVSRSPTCS